MVNRFAEQRIKRAMTIEELSEKCGIPQNELTEIEDQGFNVEEMSAVKAARIAEALGCYIKDLIYTDE